MDKEAARRKILGEIENLIELYNQESDEEGPLYEYKKVKLTMAKIENSSSKIQLKILVINVLRPRNSNPNI